MSLLNDPVFMLFSGEPVTGRTPVSVRVIGSDLSSDQRNLATREFASFKNACRLSITPLQMQWATLRDGSVMRMVSNCGLDQVIIWPAGGAPAAKLPHGFAVVSNWATPAIYKKRLSDGIWSFDEAEVPQVTGKVQTAGLVLAPIGNGNDALFLPIIMKDATAEAAIWVYDYYPLGNRYALGAGGSGSIGAIPVNLRLSGAGLLNPLPHFSDGYRVYSGAAPFAVVPPIYAGIEHEERATSLGFISVGEYSDATTDASGTRLALNGGLFYQRAPKATLMEMKLFYDVVKRLTDTTYASDDSGEQLITVQLLPLDVGPVSISTNGPSGGNGGFFSSRSQSLGSLQTYEKISALTRETGVDFLSLSIDQRATTTEAWNAYVDYQVSTITGPMTLLTGDHLGEGNSMTQQNVLSQTSDSYTLQSSPCTKLQFGWTDLALYEAEMHGSLYGASSQTRVEYLGSTDGSYRSAVTSSSRTPLSSTSRYTAKSRFLLDYDHRARFFAALRVEVGCPDVVTTLFSGSLTMSTVVAPVDMVLRVFFESNWNGLTAERLLFTRTQSIMPMFLDEARSPTELKDLGYGYLEFRIPPVSIFVPAGIMQATLRKASQGQGHDSALAAADVLENDDARSETGIEFTAGENDSLARYATGMIYARSIKIYSDFTGKHPALWLAEKHGFDLTSETTTYHIELRDGVLMNWSDDLAPQTGSDRPPAQDRQLKLYRV